MQSCAKGIPLGQSIAQSAYGVVENDVKPTPILRYAFAKPLRAPALKLQRQRAKQGRLRISAISRRDSFAN